MPAMAATNETVTSTGTTEIVQTIQNTETTTGDIMASQDVQALTDGTFTFSDANATYKITESGTYTVTGTCAEGSLVIGNGLDVTLNMTNLNLTSSTTAPVVIKKGSNVNLVLSGVNTLTDKEDASTEDTNRGGSGRRVFRSYQLYGMP